MTLLGIDTSTSASAACVLRADGASFEVEPPPSRLRQGPGHARELMPAIASVMERAGLEFGELEAIAVGVGPGTFTGLRIGIATARALASAGDLAVRPVSSLAALAEGIDADARLDQLHLLVQVGLAGVDLLELGVAVARRAALEHVRDEHVGSLQADLPQQLVEQLAGATWPDEPARSAGMRLKSSSSVFSIAGV